jgi:hypothetical protein
MIAAPLIDFEIPAKRLQQVVQGFQISGTIV